MSRKWIFLTKNFGTWIGSGSAPFMDRKKTVMGKNAAISKMVHLQVRKEKIGHYFFKISFDEQDFQGVDMRRNWCLSVIMPDCIPVVRDKKKLISVAKFNDLQKILTWIPQEYRDYFRSLPSEQNVDEYPQWTILLWRLNILIRILNLTMWYYIIIFFVVRVLKKIWKF